MNPAKANSSSQTKGRRTAITRRAFFYQAAAPLALMGLASFSRADEPALAQTKMGIASTSFGLGGPPTGNAAGSRPPQARDAYEFLEKCNALGAAGIQTQLNGDLAKLRARAEQLGMWVEGMVSIPRNGDLTAFERSLQDAKIAGATVVRGAMLSGRRYESFASLAEWKRWVDQSHEAIRLALPILEKQKITLAIENHKDWTLEDLQRLLRTYQSENLGVCLDFGNNIALLDDPLEVVETLAPYAKATHVKDMGVRPYADGFLLSEVPLGTGLLDLPRIMAILQKANPRLQYALEMITRDPLKVPCLTTPYWTVFPERNGRYLARTLKLVQEHASDALPMVSQLTPEERARVEEENIKLCFQYARDKRLIA
jgi:sugar phosphate isomerase/epimerase